MKIRTLILNIITIFTMGSAHAELPKDKLYYTVMPNMAFLAHIEKSSDNGYMNLQGVLPKLIEDIADELNLNAQPIPLRTPYEALTTAERGGSEEINTIDMIAGVYYNERTAKYMTYIHPAIFKDPILTLFPQNIKETIKRPTDFQKLEQKQLKGVTIKGIRLGNWFEDIKKDKTGNWDKLVYQKQEKEAQPLTVETVDTIDDAMIKVMNGTHYFVGSYLMLNDFLKRHPSAIGQIQGGYIYVDNEPVIHSIFLAINNDFLDIFESLDAAHKIQKKIEQMKKSGELEQRILEHRTIFRN